MKLSPLHEILAKGTLTEEAEGYLLGRGVKEETYTELGCMVWQPPNKPIPGLENDSEWLRYGKEGRAEYLGGWLIIPILGPRGKVLGFEGRRMDVKKITRYLLPEAAWNPIWTGLTPTNMQRIWDGGDVWVSEGFFDVAALQWAAPETDACLGSLRAKLTRDHVEFLRRFCRGMVNMVYDNDVTGRHGTFGWTDESGKKRWGALKSLAHAGLPCRDVPYAGGKDPGEIWVRCGVEGIRAEINQWRLT